MSEAPAIDVAGLAAELAAAERERTPIPKLVDRHPDLDLETAYRIQQTGFERRLVADKMLGYKLGLTSRAKQLNMGVTEPLWARLSAAMRIAEEEPLALNTLIHPRVEAEIAFLIGEDIDGATATTASVLAATAGVLPALEIIDSRYQGFHFTLPDVIADNASAARFLLGGRLLPPSAVDLQLEGMVMRVDGEVVETAAGAAVSGHPATAVAWLAGRLGTLPAGAVVLSGGLTAAVPLAGCRAVSAEYATLGTLALRVS